MHLSIFGLNLAASFSNVALKMRFVMSMYKIHANLGDQLTQSEDNVHLSIFARKFAVLFQRDLESKISNVFFGLFSCPYIEFMQ